MGVDPVKFVGASVEREPAALAMIAGRAIDQRVMSFHLGNSASSATYASRDGFHGRAARFTGQGFRERPRNLVQRVQAE